MADQDFHPDTYTPASLRPGKPTPLASRTVFSVELLMPGKPTGNIGGPFFDMGHALDYAPAPAAARSGTIQLVRKDATGATPIYTWDAVAKCWRRICAPPASK